MKALNTLITYPSLQGALEIQVQEYHFLWQSRRKRRLSQRIYQVSSDEEKNIFICLYNVPNVKSFAKQQLKIESINY